MRRIQIILIYLGFLGIYVEMTVITVVTAGESPMGITSEFEARILYMIKARFWCSSSNHTHYLASTAVASFWLFSRPYYLWFLFFIDRFLQESLLWNLLLLTGSKIQSEWTMLLEEKAVLFKWVRVWILISWTPSPWRTSPLFLKLNYVATVYGSPCW